MIKTMMVMTLMAMMTLVAMMTIAMMVMVTLMTVIHLKLRFPLEYASSITKPTIESIPSK